MQAVFICLVLTLLVLVQYFHNAANLALTKQSKVENSVALPNATVLKVLGLGFDELIFDYYWLEFIQYIGDEKNRKADHAEKAAAYLELLTSLDPKFTPAYYFAAIILGENNKSDQAAAFIDRGIAANPDNWYLPYIAGINQYLFVHDDRRAANYYEMASKFPYAPDWLMRQSKILMAKIPSTIKEINVWDSVYRSAPNNDVRQRAHDKLVVLWMQVYKTSPTDKIKQRAADQLKELGVATAE